MEDLNLPIIRGALPEAKRLSMDEYLKFIDFQLKYVIDKKVIRKQKKIAAVNIPFSFSARQQ